MCLGANFIEVNWGVGYANIVGINVPVLNQIRFHTVRYDNDLVGPGIQKAHYKSKCQALQSRWVGVLDRPTDVFVYIEQDLEFFTEQEFRQQAYQVGIPLKNTKPRMRQCG